MANKKKLNSPLKYYLRKKVVISIIIFFVGFVAIYFINSDVEKGMEIIKAHYLRDLRNQRSVEILPPESDTAPSENLVPVQNP
jgi:hypothetical protein